MVERKLGRGLDFFLSGSRKAAANAAATGESAEVMQVDVARVVPGSGQPRREFSVQDLEELAESIRATGVLQPILVRTAGEKFEIIAGERRWRAAKMAGLERVPALVREVDDQSAAIYALVENIQRTDLNAIEKAKAFQKITALAGGSQEEVARRVGLDRSTLANFVRLLELPDPVQQHVSRGTLSMGHARALLGLKSAKDQTALADDVIRKRLSVRDVEEIVKAAAPKKGQKGSKSGGKKETERPLWLKEIEEDLAEILQASVEIKVGRTRSRIAIDCIGREDFERVYGMLKGLGGE